MAIQHVINPDGFEDWSRVLALLRSAFASMAGRIDPPSSLERIDLGALIAKAREEDLILAYDEDRLIGCAFCKPAEHGLYIGKVAVDASYRHKGVARSMLISAERLAKKRGLRYLQLQVRIELVENHSAFEALGFRKIAETSHPGYNRPTSITMQRRLE